MIETPASCPRDVYTAITDRIVALIELGTGRFQMPWHCDGAPLGRPKNACSGRLYQGVNVVALWAAAEVMGFGSGEWATYKQWARLGAQVCKGEKGASIVIYKEVEKGATDPKSGTDVEETYFFARTAWVFNADQVSGWTRQSLPPVDHTEKLERVEVLIGSTGARINHGGERAYYSPSLDTIHVPNRDQFRCTGTSSATEGYYATLLHELTHWTGNSSRLDRDLTGRFGDEAYAMEELVAELGAAFLCADLAISNEPRPDHAAYVANWLRALKNDKKALFTAASKANQAADYLMTIGAVSVTRRL